MRSKAGTAESQPRAARRPSARPRVLAPLLAACLALAAAACCGTRPGTGHRVGHDVPTRFPAAERVAAIGDLHGDLDAARAALRLAGAIDEDDHWCGGDLVVVQLGDVFDRGGDEIEILDLLDRLGEDARAHGGAVHSLLGNHELMNARLDFRYVTVEGFLDFAPAGAPAEADATPADLVAGVGGRTVAMRPGGRIALRLARRNVVTVVGDTVFVHGGVLPAVARYGVERLNQETRSWLRGEAPDPPRPLLGGDGPVWSRHYSDDPDDRDCDLLDDALGRLGAIRMVVGHTIQAHGVSAACDGHVWRVDVGMSAHYGGAPAVLELGADGPRVVTGTSNPMAPDARGRSAAGTLGEEGGAPSHVGTLGGERLQAQTPVH